MSERSVRIQTALRQTRPDARRGVSATLRWIAVLLGALVVAGCETMAPPPDEPLGVKGRYTSMDGDYRIGVDDRVQVTVWRNPELSVTEPVRPDGKISVPIIGDVVAGGHTPSEVAAMIKEKLSAYIREPNVAVILTELRSHEYLSRIRVTGAVRNPRSMPYRQGITVLDAVLESGGINEFASPNSTKLYRTVKGKTQVFEVELGDILRKGKLETNATLRPGDVITVPERFF